MTVRDIQEDTSSRRDSVSLSSRECLNPDTLATVACTHPIYSGIYVPDDERWPAQFRGIGIRIEDSICVGEDNPLNLTTEAVKEVGFPAFVTLFQQDQGYG